MFFAKRRQDELNRTVSCDGWGLRCYAWIELSQNKSKHLSNVHIKTCTYMFPAVNRLILCLSTK
jgi:hypothetical protein